MTLLVGRLKSNGFSQEAIADVMKSERYHHYVSLGLDEAYEHLLTFNDSDIQQIRNDAFEPYHLDSVNDDAFETFSYNLSADIIAGIIKAGWCKHHVNQMPAFSWPIGHYLIVHI